MNEEGEIVVHLLKEDNEAENQKRNKVSSCMFCGIRLPLEQLRDTLQVNGLVSKPKVLLCNDGYFVIKLNSTEKGDEVPFSDGFE